MVGGEFGQGCAAEVLRRPSNLTPFKTKNLFISRPVYGVRTDFRKQKRLFQVFFQNNNFLFPDSRLANKR